MLVIRFSRVGRHNHAQYRIVVQEKTKAPTGKHIAIVGSYDPHLKQAVLDKEKITRYIADGAQPSDSVYNLLVREGVIEGKKRPVKIPAKKKEAKKEEDSEAAKELEEKKEEKSQDTKEKEQKDSSESGATEKKEIQQEDSAKDDKKQKETKEDSTTQKKE